MKKMIRALLCAGVLTVLLTCGVSAASTEDYTTATNDRCTVTYDTKTENFTAEYEQDGLEGQFVLLVVKGTPDSYSITEDNILYIDQAGAEMGKVSFDKFIPKTVTDSVVLLGGKFGDEANSPVVLGTIKSQYMLGDVNEDGYITIKDPVKTLRAVAELDTLTPSQKLAADVVKDGEITVKDAVKLLRVVAELDALS